MQLYRNHFYFSNQKINRLNFFADFEANISKNKKNTQRLNWALRIRLEQCSYFMQIFF